MILSKKRLLVIIILLGGLAVLGSYMYGTRAYAGEVDRLWGDVPEVLLPLYNINMLLAALGYFAFTYFVLFRLDVTEVKVFQRYGFGIFNWLYAAILAPSALWMPLTVLALEQGSNLVLWAVRVVLWIVAVASLGVLLALWRVEPRQPGWTHRMAVIGSLFFCLQTVVLDGLVWTAFFRLF